MSETDKIDSEVLDTENTWEKLGLDDRLMKAVYVQGWKFPSLVQSSAIPLALQGKDILARAKTGSGKTAAYSLPIIQMILLQKEREKTEPSVKSLVLVPTRELCTQLLDHFELLIKFCKGVTVHAINSDAPLKEQRARLAEKPDILISTPGKLLEHLQNKNVTLANSLKMVVIDEADLVLSFGYEEDVKKIVTYFPKIIQGFVMSATLSNEVEILKKLVLHTPVILQLEEPETTPKLMEYYAECSKDLDKFLVLFALFRLKVIPGKTLVFVNNLDRCYQVKLFLERFGIKSAVLNSELPFNSRVHVLEQFNRGVFEILIATDEKLGQEPSEGKKRKKENEDEANQADFGVARGIDFKGVQTVVNFDFPLSYKSYVHRIGRTARGRSKGNAMSLILPSEKELFEATAEQRTAAGSKIKAYQLNWTAIEAFRYRVEGEFFTVGRTAVHNARISEIKVEMLNSEKLKSHFAENPKDLDILRHDVVLQKVHVKPHLANIPSYLLPSTQAEPEEVTLDDSEASPGIFYEAPAKKRKDDGKKHYKNTKPKKTFKWTERKKHQ